VAGNYAAVLATPFGALGLLESDGRVTEIRFLPPGTPPSPASSAQGQAISRWIAGYLADPDQPPLPDASAPSGTPFQRRVWAAIARIPRGQVRSYGDLARELASAPRAVGQACGANPLPLLIPCHRVVSAQGLGGFANAKEGYRLDAKRWLLTHEGAL
jgi:methylated-DNA-[protein]-cysteine S-methyltransferase